MSEVANINEIKQNTVPVEETAAETPSKSTPAEKSRKPTPTESEAEAPAVTDKQKQKQVVNNNSEVEEPGAGDAGTSVEEAAKPAESSPKVESKKSPVKRTPSKRMTFIERAQKESEELVKNMGGSLEIEGGRRTRSSARGTPTRGTAVSTPPPAKKARTSPANASSTPSRGRGRGRKIDISEESEEAKEVTEGETAKKSEKGKTPEKVKTPEKGKTPDKKDRSADKQNSTSKEASPAAKKSAEKSSNEEKKDQKDTSVSIDEHTEDTTDAKAVVENIAVEKQNDDPRASRKEIETDTADLHNTNDSPMDTDDEPQIVETTQAATQPEVEEVPQTVESRPAEVTPSTATEEKAPTEVVKLLTPEPMDVDSNSKSSDVELIESIPAPAAVSACSSAPAEAAVKNTVDEVKIIDADVVDANTAVNANNIDSAHIDASHVAPAKPNAPAVGNAETNAKTLNEIEKSAKVESVTDAAAGSEANEVNANNDGNVKPENDLCVPKVVSPSLNNANTDGSVTAIL